MRNLKKILALALVFAMAFTFTAGAADFTDKAEIGANYVDDVNMLVELGVIAGYPDGSFGPQKNITRAEFAKMAYTLKYGSDTNGELFAAQKSTFADVEGNANVAWAKGYINYCANQKIVSGKGANKFDPQGNITVAEATKMILVILGCDPAKEGFTGANWAANVTAKAIDLGVFDGWTGDPTTLATRELVAKLMKNAIFAPVYTYSAITGAGSQLNALGTAYNKTLGQTTMNLEYITGIVVGNENYALTKDANGDPIIMGYNNAGNAVVATRADLIGSDNESKIYYVYKNEDGDEETRILTVPVALDDTMIGNEVSVFFKADRTKDNWYKNVKLIGDIMLTNDNVVYEVPAVNVKLYPDGQSTSTTPVYPSINFTTDDGEEISIETNVTRVAKNVDIQAAGAAAIFTEFGSYAWVSDATVRGYGLGLTSDPVRADDFFQDMGTPALTTYRFISVDGGETYSYIIKMVADDGTNINYGAITNFSEAKNSITIAGLGTYALDEVVYEGELAADDLVVYCFENGFLNIVKAEAVSGAVTALNDDGSAVIGDKTYYLWRNAYQDTALDLYNDDTLASYLTRNTSAMSENTTYFVCGNLVLGFETKVAEAAVEDYAVIVKSTYDADLDVAYVTLGHVDNTQATYEVGKLNVENRTNPYDEKNDKASDFADNTFFGMVVKYKVMDNGKLDLSANDLGYASGKQTVLGSKVYSDTTYYSSSRYDKGVLNVVAEEGELAVDGKTYYALNNSSVIFVLYGNPQYQNNKTVLRDAAYTPVKAVAYKLTDKKLQTMADIPSMLIDTVQNSYAFSYVLNTTKGMGKGIIAAAMTVGAASTDDTGDAAAAEAIAYVAASTQRYDVATNKYFLEMTIIDENGLVSTKTISGVRDFNNNEINFGTNIGKVVGEYEAGTFITYTLDADGVITNMDNSQFLAASYNAPAGDGLYLVNAVAERNGALFFLPTNRAYTSADAIANATTSSVKFNEKGYDVITIDDGAYVGETIIKVSARENNLSQFFGNALIQVDQGEIIRVFSFVEPYTLDQTVNVVPSEIEGVAAVMSGDILGDGTNASTFYQGTTQLQVQEVGNTYKVNGTLKKVTGYAAYSTDVADQEGHYIALEIDLGYVDPADPNYDPVADAAEAANFAGTIDTKAGVKPLGLEANNKVMLLIRVENYTESAVYNGIVPLELDIDGNGAEEYKIDLTGLTLLQ